MNEVKEKTLTKKEYSPANLEGSVTGRKHIEKPAAEAHFT